MAVTPRRHLIVTEHRPHRRLRAGLLVVLALAAVVAAFWAGGYFAVPEATQLREELHTLRADHAKVNQRLERLTQKLTTLERSEQVERDAARALQTTLAERDAELASLRNDVAFYERLAGGDSQRHPLAVHSLGFEPLDSGSWRYLLTLTQNLKRATISKGQYTLRVEGAQDGILRTLEWPELMQSPEAAPGEFSFKYFQQIEGSLALPAGFVPHRVRISIHSDQGQTEQTLPWSESINQE